MSHKCFISFKKEDIHYKNLLLNILKKEDIVGKALNKVIDSVNSDYIMQKIREEYLSNSTVTLFLIGKHSSENEGGDYLGRAHNYFIQRELQASLYNGPGNTRNGIVGIVLPEMYDAIYTGFNNNGDAKLDLSDNTVIREFGANYFIKPHEGNVWRENERYCILAKWDDFVLNPDKYINKAFDKRFSDIAKKIKIRNLR